MSAVPNNILVALDAAVNLRTQREAAATSVPDIVPVLFGVARMRNMGFARLRLSGFVGHYQGRNGLENAFAADVQRASDGEGHGRARHSLRPQPPVSSHRFGLRGELRRCLPRAVSRGVSEGIYVDPRWRVG